MCDQRQAVVVWSRVEKSNESRQYDRTHTDHTFDHVVKEFRQRGSGTDGGKRGTTVARAVDDVSLTINEVTFRLIGYSGAGKSRLCA